MEKELGFRGALLVGHIGKLVKLAGGMFNTHSKYGDCRMEILAAHAGAAGLDAAGIAEVLDCAACDAALEVMDRAGLREKALSSLAERIANQLPRRAGEELETGVIVFSNQYGFLCETAGARALLDRVARGN